jgi:hypothetical protein
MIDDSASRFDADWRTSVTRRALFNRRGALVAGTGATLLGAAAVGALMRDGADPAGGAEPSAAMVFNARDLGAHGDGKTDDTDALQRAIAAARQGGGIVYVPPGVYLTRKLTIYSGVHLRGAGGDATLLRLRPGANSAIIESDRFEKLSGSRGEGGIGDFSIRDLALDGNKQHNPNGGYGLRLYAYGYELTEVIAYNCRNDGIYSEWGTLAALPPPSHQMEARLTALRTHDNDGHGVNFNGPHDSMFLNCVSSQNNVTGFRLAGESTGTSMVNCHAWGMEQNVAFELAAGAINCMNCYADFNGGIGVRVSRSDCRWVGGLIAGYNHPQEIGLQLLAGPKPTEPAGILVDTKIMNCGTAAVDFGADRGLSSIRALLSQPGVVSGDGRGTPGTGLGWIGKPAPSTQVELVAGIGDTTKSLVVRPAFDLRAQETPPPPDLGAVRLFVRTVGGQTQLCARFPGGAIKVLADG